jgi:hypothetical protein
VLNQFHSHERQQGAEPAQQQFWPLINQISQKTRQEAEELFWAT